MAEHHTPFDLWLVVLGGAISLVSTVVSTIGVKVWERRQEARALRGALRAEIASTLAIAEARGHYAKAREYLRHLDAGQDLHYHAYGVSSADNTKIFDDNAGKLGLIGRSLASDVAAFYTHLKATLITVAAFENGVLNTWPVPQRADQVRQTLAIWSEAEKIGKQLARRL